MTEKRTKRQVELGETELAVIGPGPADLQRLIEALCPAMSDLLEANETVFAPEEWRAMASVMQTESVPYGQRGLDRFLYLVSEAETYDHLSETHGIQVEPMQEKLKGLDGFALVGVLSTLQFALHHFADRLESAVWWTLTARRELTREALASKSAQNKPSPPKRRRVSENGSADAADDRALAAT